MSCTFFLLTTPLNAGYLFRMITDPKSSHFIAWTELGTSFVVSNVGEFSRSILGAHFKHNNVSIFSMDVLSLFAFRCLLWIECAFCIPIRHLSRFGPVDNPAVSLICFAHGLRNHIAPATTF